jgi:hypothetical protein
MQTKIVSLDAQSPELNIKSSKQSQTTSPVLDRLMKEVKNENMTASYDRVHNRHNRGR